MTTITAAHAKALASQIVLDNPDFAPVLIELLDGLLDRDGDALKYSAGEETMRFLYTLTPQFQEAFDSYLREPQLELSASSPSS